MSVNKLIPSVLKPINKIIVFNQLSEHTGFVMSLTSIEPMLIQKVDAILKIKKNTCLYII